MIKNITSLLNQLINAQSLLWHNKNKELFSPIASGKEVIMTIDIFFYSIWNSPRHKFPHFMLLEFCHQV